MGTRDGPLYPLPFFWWCCAHRVIEAQLRYKGPSLAPCPLSLVYKGPVHFEEIILLRCLGYMDKEKSILPEEKLGNLLGKYQVIAAYLFGSRAEGTYTDNSDYDFALLVDKDYDQNNVNNLIMELEEKAASLLQKEVDVVILNTATIEFKYLIISRGKVIYSIDEEKRTDFEDVVIRDYLDFKPFLELYRKEVRKAIKEGNFFNIF